MAYALFSRSEHTKISAYLIFILSAVGAGVAYLTGEAAEESVENLQGVMESGIEQHEDFAIYALVSLITLGVVSLLGLFLTFKKSNLTRAIAKLTLFISLLSFGLVAYTGFLGGKIRHTEISAQTNEGLQQNEAEEGEED
jgi:uncharacterized membrane protein